MSQVRKMKMMLSLALTVVGLSTMGANCYTSGGGYGGGGGGGCTYNCYDPYYKAWYDLYGYQCNYGYPSPGCNFYSDGWKIKDFEDPYFSSGYTLNYGNWYVNGYYYTGWAWQSSTGIIYDEYGNALNRNSSGMDRDLIEDVAELEARVVESAGKDFADKYALSQEQGVRVARVLNDWATLAKKRSRTGRDIADFTKRLYGLDFDRVSAALAEAQLGKKDELNSAIGEAAKNWGTSPENMKDIMKSWFGNQVPDSLK